MFRKRLFIEEKVHQLSQRQNSFLCYSESAFFYYVSSSFRKAKAYCRKRKLCNNWRNGNCIFLLIKMWGKDLHFVSNSLNWNIHWFKPSFRKKCLQFNTDAKLISRHHRLRVKTQCYEKTPLNSKYILYFKGNSFSGQKSATSTTWWILWYNQCGIKLILHQTLCCLERRSSTLPSKTIGRKMTSKFGKEVQIR